MQRPLFIALLAATIGSTACQTSEKTSDNATGTRPSTESPAGAAPAAEVPKATDPASVKTLILDPSASKFDFSAAKVTKTHHGSFKRFTGVATQIGEELQSIAVEVDTASVDIDDPKLTQHLKTPDFLDVEKFPKATFKSSGIQKKPAGEATHEISGDLTLHGVTQPVTFPAKISLTPAGVSGSGVIRIDRQKFGVRYPGMPDDLIKDEVTLEPSFVFKP
jgi:polyisoprenoid-binding protein YceI